MLYAALRKSKGKSTDAPGVHRALRRQGLVDQSPISKTTRLNRARYVGTFDAILRLYAQQPLAKECKYSANVSNVGETCHSKVTTLPAAMADLCGLVLRQVWQCSGRSEDGFAATPCGSSWPTGEVGFSAVKDRKLCVAVVGVENLAGRNRHIATR
jgi:hypothetical protein